MDLILSILVRANEDRQHGNYQQAIARYEEVITLSGESAAVDSVIAACYYAMAMSEHGTSQDGDEAIMWLKKALALSPDDASLYARLGEYYWLITYDYKQALQSYYRALELDPCNAKAMLGIAALYGIPEQVVTLEEAIRWMERAVQLSPDDPNLYIRLGNLYLEAGQQSRAREMWLRALSCPKTLAPDMIRAILEHYHSTDESGLT